MEFSEFKKMEKKFKKMKNWEKEEDLLILDENLEHENIIKYSV